MGEEQARRDAERPTDRAAQIRRALSRLRKAALALGSIIVGGTAGYMVLEGWGFLDALYMTMITISTVGYGEVNELDTTGRLWSIALIITGASVLVYATGSFVELVLEGTIRGYFARRRMEEAIGNLNGHYILCGYGRVGRQVAREFADEGVDFVVVDQEDSEVERSWRRATWLCTATPRTMPYWRTPAWSGRRVWSPRWIPTRTTSSSPSPHAA